MKKYEIEHCDNGILIMGKVPSRDLVELLKMFARIYGYDQCDALIANYFQATMCLTTEYHSNIWRKELNI